MSAQPEALQLADVSRLSRHHEWHLRVDAELRRLSAIEAQRDEMLEALKLYVFWRAYRDEHDTLLPSEMQEVEIAQGMRVIARTEGQ